MAQKLLSMLQLLQVQVWQCWLALPLSFVPSPLRGKVRMRVNQMRGAFSEAGRVGEKNETMPEHSDSRSRGE